MAAGRSRWTAVDPKGQQPSVPATATEAADLLPGLTFEYAEQIAKDWNSKDARHDYVGFVTEFDVRAEVVAAYEPHQVGARRHRELWVPAEELDAFNEALAGEIRIAAEYQRGERVR